MCFCAWDSTKSNWLYMYNMHFYAVGQLLNFDVPQIPFVLNRSSIICVNFIELFGLHLTVQYKTIPAI